MQPNVFAGEKPDDISGESEPEIGPMRRDEIAAVAALHHEFFGGPEHAHSLARMGPRFLADVFYGPSFDNPHFHVDVARAGSRLVGFSAYLSDAPHVFRRTLRQHPVAIGAGVVRQALKHPLQVAGHVFHNLAFVSGQVPPEVANVRGHQLLLGVVKEFRGRRISSTFLTRMEETLRELGCSAFWAAPAAANKPSVRVFETFGARPVASGIVQGVECVYYRKDLTPLGQRASA